MTASPISHPLSPAAEGRHPKFAPARLGPRRHAFVKSGDRGLAIRHDLRRHWQVGASNRDGSVRRTIRSRRPTPCPRSGPRPPHVQGPRSLAPPPAVTARTARAAVTDQPARGRQELWLAGDTYVVDYSGARIAKVRRRRAWNSAHTGTPRSPRRRPLHRDAFPELRRRLFVGS